jgi:hypothetical protein
MIEHELRAGLDLAIATEPPLAFDPDALMARAERERRRRRSLAGVGVATAVIAAGAVAVPTALHLDTGPARIGTASGLTTETPEPPSHRWPPADVHRPNYSAAQLTSIATKWTHEIERVLPRLVPSVTAVSVQEWGGEAAGAVSDGQGYLDTFTDFTLHGTRTAVYVQVDAPGQRTGTPESDCAREPNAGCTISWQGPSALVELTGTTGGQRLLTVRQYRADGSVVSVTAYNYDPTANHDPTAGRATAGPTDVPLTAAQLTVLAEDPALIF